MIIIRMIIMRVMWGYITPQMENKMDNHMDNDVETVV